MQGKQLSEWSTEETTGANAFLVAAPTGTRGAARCGLSVMAIASAERR